MSELLERIRQAKVEAAEKVVMDWLREMEANLPQHDSSAERTTGE